MKIIYGLPTTDFYPETALALGFFDGVHRGHQRLLDEVKKAPYPCGVLTFETPPKKEGKLLQTNEQKLELLESLGMDFVILLPFTETLAKTSPEDFVEQVLIGACHAKTLVVGEDYRFGRDAVGTATLLKTLMGEDRVTVCPLLDSPYGTVSSSLIREFLTTNRLKEAESLLGRPYAMRGTVIHGQQLGSTMGFPTANLEITGQLVPSYGVYETRVTVEGETIPAVTNVGYRPTVNGERLTIESNLLGFDRMIYGKTITLTFIRYLRDERKFDSKEELFAQIEEDGQRVLKDLQKNPLQMD